MTLIISLSGRKQAGKNTACNFIVSEFLKLKASKRRGAESYLPLYITEEGYMAPRYSSLGDNDPYYCKQITNQFEHLGVKVYSFADPLKRFCIDVLGVPEEYCYGTDVQKNTSIPHLLWDNLPREIVPYVTKKTEEKHTEFSGVTHPSVSYNEYKTGSMTARDVMQIFGTEVCRKLYADCWALGTINAIKKDNPKIALICDARFPNEIDISKKFGAKVIRLLRKVSDDNHASEVALDNYPIENYDAVIENQNMTIQQTCEAIKPFLDNWMKNI